MRKRKIDLDKRSKKANSKPYNQFYNSEFVEKILQGEEDIKNGKGVKIDPEIVWNN